MVIWTMHCNHGVFGNSSLFCATVVPRLQRYDFFEKAKCLKCLYSEDQFTNCMLFFLYIGVSNLPSDLNIIFMIKYNFTHCLLHLFLCMSNLYFYYYIFCTNNVQIRLGSFTFCSY